MTFLHLALYTSSNWSNFRSASPRWQRRSWLSIISDCNDDISFLRVWPNHWHQQLHASTPKMVDLCRFTHLVDSWISKGQLIHTYDYSTNQNWIAHQQCKCMAVEPPKKMWSSIGGHIPVDGTSETYAI